MCYAQDFLETWSGCDLIVGTSSGVPIKRRAGEAIGATTPIGKGKEKNIKRKRLKELSLKRVLRVLRLRRGRLQDLRNS